MKYQYRLDYLMSPQKENGYTAIANEIMEALIKYPIAATQMQCLLFIIRKTYGYNKKTDKISLSQFEKHTGLDRRHCYRAIKELESKNIIKVLKGSAKNGTKKTTEYRLNKVYTSWVFVPKMARGSAKNGTKGSAKNGTNKRHIKDNKELNADSNESATIKFEFYKTKSGKKLAGKRLESFNLFWNIFDLKQGKSSAADSWLKIDPLTNRILKQILKAAKIESEKRSALIEKGYTPKWAQGWITERRWEDEIYQDEEQTRENILKKHGIGVES